jgi:hypothetical protein
MRYPQVRVNIAAGVGLPAPDQRTTGRNWCAATDWLLRFFDAFRGVDVFLSRDEAVVAKFGNPSDLGANA